MIMPATSFRYIKGTPARFARSDLDDPVTREFCGTCGTHIATRRSDMPDVILKIGTLDDPGAEYRASRLAIYVADQQPWHNIPENIPCFKGLPPRS